MHAWLHSQQQFRSHHRYDNKPQSLPNNNDNESNDNNNRWQIDWLYRSILDTEPQLKLEVWPHHVNIHHCWAGTDRHLHWGQATTSLWQRGRREIERERGGGGREGCMFYSTLPPSYYTNLDLVYTELQGHPDQTNTIDGEQVVSNVQQSRSVDCSQLADMGHNTGRDCWPVPWVNDHDSQHLSFGLV